MEVKGFSREPYFDSLIQYFDTIQETPSQSKVSYSWHNKWQPETFQKISLKQSFCDELHLRSQTFRRSNIKLHHNSCTSCQYLVCKFLFLRADKENLQQPVSLIIWKQKHLFFIFSAIFLRQSKNSTWYKKDFCCKNQGQKRNSDKLLKRNLAIRDGTTASPLPNSNN